MKNFRGCLTDQNLGGWDINSYSGYIKKLNKKMIKKFDKFVNESSEPEAWKIASDKINQLKDSDKENTPEYYLAYAEYYMGLIDKNGDSNGYYFRQVKYYQKLAHDTSDVGKNENELREYYRIEFLRFFDIDGWDFVNLDDVKFEIMAKINNKIQSLSKPQKSRIRKS